jgi:hypothetical protein
MIRVPVAVCRIVSVSSVHRSWNPSFSEEQFGPELSGCRLLRSIAAHVAVRSSQRTMHLLSSLGKFSNRFRFHPSVSSFRFAMSTKVQSALSSLPANITALVTAASETLGSDANLHGKVEKDHDEVAAWIDRVAKGDIVKEDNLKDLNVELAPKTYIAANYLTAADISLYAGLHPTFLRPSASR